MKKNKTKPAATPRAEGEKPRRTIRFKIILLCVLIAMVPLVISCVLSVSISLRNGKTVAYDLVEDRTDSVAQQVQAYVQQGYSVMESVAAMKSLRY